MTTNTNPDDTVPASEAAWRTAEHIATQRTNHGVEQNPTWTPADGCDGYCFRMTHPDHGDRFVEVVLAGAPSADDEVPVSDEDHVERVGIWEGDVDDPDLIATPIRGSVDPV
jgi:hypothetical protein